MAALASSGACRGRGRGERARLPEASSRRADRRRRAPAAGDDSPDGPEATVAEEPSSTHRPLRCSPRPAEEDARLRPTLRLTDAGRIARSSRPGPRIGPSIIGAATAEALKTDLFGGVRAGRAPRNRLSRRVTP